MAVQPARGQRPAAPSHAGTRAASRTRRESPQEQEGL